VTWYRLLLTSTSAQKNGSPQKNGSSQKDLRALRYHVVDTCIDTWGMVPRDMALFARYTDRGGYEVRFTKRLHLIISRAAPRHYIEETGPPRGWDQWSLQVGGGNWPDQLGIRPAEW
jgi:hypothetical protein